MLVSVDANQLMGESKLEFLFLDVMLSHEHAESAPSLQKMMLVSPLRKPDLNVRTEAFYRRDKLVRDLKFPRGFNSTCLLNFNLGRNIP